ncbi:MAG: PepSY domain-containing protein [Gammaproteobacteria bacterium]|uniref:Peptidase propeptide and YPEB domain-containing protein n=1 Tax=Pseudomonas cuatrocienegasensis TaxID=543360 RepID=A0ABY1BFA6_9PSED|nr:MULTISPECIES: PepSY domain-containing protein [Pseudomonas]MBU1333070.1 PepSY domain-containing protein [Gammaproteobacteria bacterium]MBU2067613.1 PepSY domain-containing protein [Gammaproteobacteria bacterium]MBU2138914.1 PepSY domain-containing protein [Gammaproteobacteria bacterium]MBU2216883.1 PepSY domain-containing protein [Gammaproteobacteria bacterium]MBU2325692.1 PepSY domain-containing protein [Gammaproteobacteria bacterium]
MNRLIPSAALCAALLLALAGTSSARDLDQDEALRLRRDGLILPLDQLMRPALQRYPGATLLEAELEEEDDVLVYEVELLTPQGIVRELELDARDGRILKDEVDD